MARKNSCQSPPDSRTQHTSDRGNLTVAGQRRPQGKEEERTKSCCVPQIAAPLQKWNWKRSRPMDRRLFFRAIKITHYLSWRRKEACTFIAWIAHLVWFSCCCLCVSALWPKASVAPRGNFCNFLLTWQNVVNYCHSQHKCCRLFHNNKLWLVISKLSLFLY